MSPSSRVCIYRWADAPPAYKRRFAGSRRDFIVWVPKGSTLRDSHFARRLEDPAEKARRDGSTLIAGNEPTPGEAD